MYKQFFLLILFWGFHSSRAQEVQYLHIFKDHNFLTAYAVGLEREELLDSTIYIAGYTLSYQKEAWNKFDWVDEAMTLQIGQQYSVCYPDVLLEIDQRYTANNRAAPVPSAVYPKLWTSYYNIQKKTMESVHRMPFANEFLISYKDPLPEIKWELQPNEPETIAGYQTQKASAFFRGRKWVVWFTLDIPTPVPLWNLGGLPGLILKAETDRFRIVVNSLRNDRVPIKRPLCNYKTYSRKKWRQFERSYHETPYIFFNGNGQHEFYYETVKLTNENWNIEYNPIELE